MKQYKICRKGCCQRNGEAVGPECVDHLAHFLRRKHEVAAHHCRPSGPQWSTRPFAFDHFPGPWPPAATPAARCRSASKSSCADRIVDDGARGLSTDTFRKKRPDPQFRIEVRAPGVLERLAAQPAWHRWGVWHDVDWPACLQELKQMLRDTSSATIGAATASATVLMNRGRRPCR